MLMEGVPPPSDPIENKHGDHMYADDDLKAELQNIPVDDPFGNEATAEVKYKTLKWWQCGMFMIAESVSLGVLSLPATLDTLGFVPALILIVGLGILALYTGYVIGQFRERHPHIHNLADAGEILMGRFGRELFGLGQILFSIFIMGSHIVTFTVMMNTITEHGTCSIVFSIVGMVICLVLSLPRTIKNMTYISIASFLSIFSAVMITMIGVGVQYKGGVNIYATQQTNIYHGFTAVTNIVFAYCAHVAFFGLIAEMEEPKDFTKALCLLQGFEIVLYVVAATVIYYYVGTGVASPALGSAGPVLKKVAYGVAIPTIIGAGVVNGHVGPQSGRMAKRDFVSVGSWVAIGVTCWVIAWIIGEGIPSFTNIVSLISSLFASWFTYGLSGVYWLHMNWGYWFSSPRKIALTILNFLIVGIGGTICGLGLYASGKAIHDDSSRASFTCANNAD
ncbi:transmembrane amino acid transporter protein-domain-containing protein [Aspergillus pseudonomiae]|uniref:Transmembrane amino acid transporter protein-domain-containing protein n=1 Tax=Aspergillus pseudonomiae TaxID=1506151 RepID=A0A5N7D2L0_9EURO|nr:transmembrane amino acid transporter protein-domain-containing protein [Aspergillus pseudonomiae]KAE8400367.1 transmembrane amino acid transporter protein-domain-containing protein [Aspergillus pseudonomiae]